MSVVSAAVVPSPPLLARGMTGRSVVLPELRKACAVAVGRLLSVAADAVVVVGAGPATAAWDPEGRLNTAAWAGGLGRGEWGATGRILRSSPRGYTGLPLALGLGAQLLDEAGYAGPRVLQAISQAATSAECLALGATIAGLAPRVALLVVGDGSARRSPAAPGYFDERAEAFDVSAETFLRAGDMAGLASLAPGLAAELLATGRAAWQVLAGAVGLDRRAPADVLYADIPFGVSYLVAVLDHLPQASLRRPQEE